MRRLLFLSRRNAGRSPMAEALARRLLGPGIVAWSAGLEPGVLHPLAVRVMSEIGIELRHEARAVRLISPQAVDLVVVLDASDLRPPELTRCDHLNWPVPELPPEADDRPEALVACRRVRDELAERIARLARVFT